MPQDLIITTYAGDLAQCLRTLDKFSSRGTIPVLGFAKITANNGSVRIESTDMDMMADLPMDAHANGDGAFTVKIRQVLGMVRGVRRAERIDDASGAVQAVPAANLLLMSSLSTATDPVAPPRFNVMRQDQPQGESP